MNDTVKAIRERMKDITPGKWRVEWDSRPDIVAEPPAGYFGEGQLIKGLNKGFTFFEDIFDKPHLEVHVAEFSKYENAVDAEFIAHAPEDMRYLLALVDTQAKRITDLEGKLKGMTSAGILLDRVLEAKNKRLKRGREIVNLLRVVITSGVSLDKEELQEVHAWLKDTEEVQGE